MKLFRSLNVLLLLSLASLTAAQAQISMVTIHGVVQQFEPPMVIVKTADGKAEQIRLSGRFQMMTRAIANAADIVPGNYVGITSKPGTDGQLTVAEVRLFPEGMRGAGEGHLSVPGGVTMTNGTVSKVINTGNGLDVTLQFDTTEMKFTIPKDVAIFAFGLVDGNSLKPGTYVSISAIRRPDGIQTASRVTVELGGPR